MVETAATVAGPSGYEPEKAHRLADQPSPLPLVEVAAAAATPPPAPSSEADNTLNRTKIQQKLNEIRTYTPPSPEKFMYRTCYYAWPQIEKNEANGG